MKLYMFINMYIKTNTCLWLYIVLLRVYTCMYTFTYSYLLVIHNIYKHS